MQRSTLDRIRVKLGLTTPLFLDLLGLHRRWRALLVAPDDTLDPLIREAALHRAEVLERKYDAWKQSILEQADAHGPYRVVDLARLFGISSDILLRNIRRGVVPAEQQPGYHNRPQYTVTPDHLRALFALNEQSVAVTRRGYHLGPLASAFLHTLRPRRKVRAA